jgi:hypothetical protein
MFRSMAVADVTAICSDGGVLEAHVHAPPDPDFSAIANHLGLDKKTGRLRDQGADLSRRKEEEGEKEGGREKGCEEDCKEGCEEKWAGKA